MRYLFSITHLTNCKSWKKDIVNTVTLGKEEDFILMVLLFLVSLSVTHCLTFSCYQLSVVCAMQTSLAGYIVEFLITTRHIKEK